MHQGRSPGAVRSHRDERDEGHNDGQEGTARVDRAESKTTVIARLRQHIAERRAERSGEDVGDPEGENRVRTEIIRRRKDGDEPAERDDTDVEAEAERFGREVACRRAESECEQNCQPVKLLAARRDDSVDGERALNRVPDKKIAQSITAKTAVLV